MQREIITDMDVYLTYIKMSSKKHILVEGESDQEMINKLIERLIEKFDANLSKNIDIDIASQFIKPTIPSVRERVEFVSDSIKNKLNANNFLGFVDREFRGFIIEPNIVDIISEHNLDGLTIWSRGHSIENYLFNPIILTETFLSLSNIKNEYKLSSAKLFNKIFQSSIRIACTISIIAFFYEKINSFIKDPFFDFIEINDDFYFKIDKWVGFIKNKHTSLNIDSDEIERYFNYIHTKILLLNDSDIQWICHGHIGLKFLRDTFSRCVYSITNNLSESARIKESQNSRRQNIDTIFSVSLNNWSYRYLNNKEIFSDVIKDFCLDITS